MSGNETPTGALSSRMAAQVEGVKELIRQAGKSANAEFHTSLFFRTHQTAKLLHGEDIDPVAEEAVAARATGSALAAFKPTDPLEGIFAAHAVMLHHLAMEAGRRAVISGQSPEVASKLRKDAANTARAFSDTVDALARYRGKGPQVVRVVRVVVNEGGQAVVGNVSAGASLPTLAPSPQVVGQGAPPMAILDAEPVEAGVGEGERDAGLDG